MRRRMMMMTVAAIGLLAAVLVAGCSGNSDVPSATAGNAAVQSSAASAGTGENGAGVTESGSTDQSQMAAFEQCMASNGVTMPERPDSSGAGQQAPRAGAPAGGTPPTGAPGATGGPSEGGAPAAPPGVDATAWKKAQAACQSYAPSQPADS